MTITKQESGSDLTLIVEGRVDTNTSPDLEKDILEAFRTVKRLSVDLSKVNYVSSAGLRVFLLGHKTAASKGLKFELLNVTPAVKAVLDSVGFSKILTIH